MDTRSTDEIVVTNSDIIDKLVSEEVSVWLKDIVDKLSKELEDLWSGEEWIKIANKPFYYLPKMKLLIVDCTRKYCKREGIDSEVDGLRVRPLQIDEAREIFVQKKTPLVDEALRFNNYNDNYRGNCYSHLGCMENNQQAAINITDNDVGKWGFGDRDIIKIPVYDFEPQISLIENFLKNDLIPQKIPKGHELYKLLKEKALIYDGGIKLSSRLEEEFNRGELDTLLGHQFSKEAVLNKLKGNGVKVSAEKQDSIIEKLLNCDNLRAKIEPYDIKRLEDPNLGHWDLWSSEGVKAKLDRTLVGRNPLADVKEDGIIGIDFGTKSTIVVYQDGDDNTQPMRVGRGDFSKELRADDFENPTVMEFINLDDFLSAYNRKEGRPDTRWEDLTISHTAFNSLLSVNTKSDEYYSFFNDLKQWSGDKTRQIRLRDKNGHEYVLPAFVDIEEDAFNPIEIYAYYLGLFINNMYKGIYLNYILSFPVTYEKEVREKIIQSFERGIKKSLPLEILHDEECMQKFRIMQGASEPAAYAICALQQYGFDPEPGEKVFYGIFDFGGGTTDFDFGIWRSADETERRYDYVINHFGAGGDKYLGGENLLELLAFEVFKENQNHLIENKIAFYKPTECRAFAGSEVLISESQEAKLNTKQLMEKLRPLWERHEGYNNLYSSNVLKVMLFDKTGNAKPNFELDINAEALENLLRERIEKGVKNFFEALKLTFRSAKIREMNNIIIFLAGNSSKSPIVADLFKQYIAERTEFILKELKGSEDREYFKVYPPLGTPEAQEIQKNNGIEVDENDLTRPTGKTGVAFGLLEGRPGSRIKVIAEKKSTDEIKFNYYIGYNAKKKFRPVFGRDTEYNKWINFIDASETDFEIYYTNLPEATNNNLPIKEVSKKICRIAEADESANVYIRAVEPSVIEYVAATEEGIGSNEFLGDIIRLELE